MATDTSKPPWKRKNPRRKEGSSKTLTAAQKAEARARARRAGREYPNLVDNMAVARTRAKRSGKKTATRRRSST